MAAAAAAEAAGGGAPAAAAADDDADAKLRAALPKSYDEEFGLEAAARRAAAAAPASAAAAAAPGAIGPHGHKFGRAPAVLHGYSAPVSGATAQERLDMRCATKADKFCR